MPLAFLRLFAAVVVAVLAGHAAAAPNGCPAQFVGGEAPNLVNPKLSRDASLLCFEAFAIGFSGLTRTPLWSAEHLTAQRVESARGLEREGRFHPEPRLPPGQSATLEDYAGSGYDRGHMAPDGDMPTEAAQAESFTLANIVPQAPALNRGLWAEIERAVRRWTTQHGDLYVVTGPVFTGTQLQFLNGQVAIPTLVFKAVYDPARQRGAAYLARNADDGGYQAISLAELTRLTGIDVFPAAPGQAKLHVAALPLPAGHQSNTAPPRRSSDTTLLQMLAAALTGSHP